MDIQETWRRKFRLEIETPRFLLRLLIADDVDWLAALFCDPDVCEFLWDGASDAKQAKDAAEAVVQFDLMRSRFGHWAIRDKSSGAIHGGTELSKLSPWERNRSQLRLRAPVLGTRHCHGGG